MTDVVTINRSNYKFKTIGELGVKPKKIQYNTLLSAIPTDWKAKLIKGEETNLQGKKFQIQHLRIDLQKLWTKIIYQNLAYRKHIPTAENKWFQYYPFLETNNSSSVHSLPSVITSDLKLQSFQNSTTHHYFTCNSKMVLCAVTLDMSFVQCLNRKYRKVNKTMLLNSACIVPLCTNVNKWLAVK